MSYLGHMTIAPEGNRTPEFGFNHRLGLARRNAGITQVEMAELLGVGRTTVGNYEAGATRPSKLAINAWAVETNVDVEWLKTGKAAVDKDPRGGNLQPSDYNAHVLALAKRRRAEQPAAGIGERLRSVA